MTDTSRQVLKVLKSIFGDDINNLDYLLPRLGEEREKINEDIQRIKKRIKEKFEELYTNNSDSEIYKFLNRTIQEAYTNCEESTKEIIQSHVNNLIFPAERCYPGKNRYSRSQYSQQSGDLCYRNF